MGCFECLNDFGDFIVGGLKVFGMTLTLRVLWNSDCVGEWGAFRFCQSKTTWYIFCQVGSSYWGDFNFPSSKRGLCFFIDPCRRREGFVSTTNLQPIYTNTVNDVLQWAVWTATDAVECLQRALGTREMCLLSYRHWKGPFGLDSIEKRQFKRVRIWNKMGSLGCNHDIDQRAVPRTQSSALEHRVWLN